MQPSPRRTAIDDRVDRWTPGEFFAELCGITEYEPHGKVRCSLSDPRRSTSQPLDRRDTRRGLVLCFGCSRGGQIFDLASLLIGGRWRVDLRGHEFRATRAEN